jgi:hypothetical protein
MIYHFRHGCQFRGSLGSLAGANSTRFRFFAVLGRESCVEFSSCPRAVELLVREACQYLTEVSSCIDFARRPGQAWNE